MNNKTPNFFPVSKTKLMVMSICTLSMYELYWFYKNWKLIKERENLDIEPFWRSVFAYFFCHSLFTRISTLSKEPKFNPILFTVLWIGIYLLWKLPDPYSLISNFSFVPLLFVQHHINTINAELSPEIDRNENFSKWNIAAVILGGSLFVLGVIGSFLPQ